MPPRHGSPRAAPGPEPLGIAAAARILLGGAVLNVGLGLAAQAEGWLGPLGGTAFVLLGLELAGMAATVALIALALAPSWRARGEARIACVTGVLAIALVGVGVTWILPRLPLLAAGG